MNIRQAVRHMMIIKLARGDVLKEQLQNSTIHKIGKVAYTISTTYKSTTKTIDDGITRLIQRELIAQRT